MTNIEMIEFIDEFLSEQEEVLHGIEGRDCTKSRKYLNMIKKQLNLTDVVSSVISIDKQVEIIKEVIDEMMTTFDDENDRMDYILDFVNSYKKRLPKHYH